MQRGKTLLFITCCGLLLTIMGCSEEGGGNSTLTRGARGDRVGGSRGIEAVPVRVAEAARGEISSFILKPTTLEAEKQVDIIAKITGYAVRRLVDEGDFVKKNQLLLSLDKQEALIAYQEAKVRLDNQQAEYERAKHMRESNLISLEGYEASKYQNELAEAQYQRAKLSLSYTEIRAPFAGIVTQRYVNIGDNIRANLPVFQIADFQPILARIYVSEKEMGQIRVGQLARITVEALSDTACSGFVQMISPIVDPESGTIKVTVEVRDEARILKPGMFCSVYIITEVHANVIIIPKKALLMDVDQDVVFVFMEGKAERRPIEIGFIDQDMMEVVSGIQAGDRVVTIGQEGLRPGTAVRVPGEEPPAVLADASPLEEPVNTPRERGSGNFNRQGGQQRGNPNQEIPLEMMERMLGRFEMMLGSDEDFRNAWEQKVKEDPSVKDDAMKKIEFIRSRRGGQRRR